VRTRGRASSRGKAKDTRFSGASVVAVSSSSSKVSVKSHPSLAKTRLQRKNRQTEWRKEAKKEGKQTFNERKGARKKEKKENELSIQDARIVFVTVSSAVGQRACAASSVVVSSRVVTAPAAAASSAASATRFGWPPVVVFIFDASFALVRIVVSSFYSNRNRPMSE
jgi:hypothetical protein